MKILQHNEPELSAVAEEVAEGEDVSFVIGEMLRIMRELGGIGLAANQIGELKRIIVIRVGSFKQTIINPVLTLGKGGKSTAKEECLSYPSLSILKVRNKKLIVRGFDENWKPVKFKLKALAARCVQHEVDHLDGITIGNIGEFNEAK